jgi:hypothetical protein
MRGNKGSGGDIGLVVLFLVILFFLWVYAKNTTNPNADKGQAISTQNTNSFRNFGYNFAPDVPLVGEELRQSN